MKKGRLFTIIGILLVLGLASTVIWKLLEKESTNVADIPEGSIMFQDFEGEDEAFLETLLASGALTDQDVFAGDQSLKYERQASGDPQEAEGSIRIVSGNGPVDASQYENLSFSIKDTQGSNTLKLSLTDSDGNSTPFAWQTPSTTKDEWVYYQVPVSQFSGIDLTSITGITIGQWNAGTYLIDDVYFSNQKPSVDLVKPEATSAGNFENYAIVELKTQHIGFPIYYTTDGSEPTKDSKLYNGLIRLNASATVKAVVYNPDYDMYSEVASYDYEVHTDAAAQAPKAFPIAGTYAETQSVTLSTVLENAKIYYTLDGSEPSASSLEYKEPISVSSDTVIKALALTDDATSDVTILEYKLDSNDTPFLKANGTTFRNNYGSGEEVVLKGTNAGGWMVMEEWMTPVKSPDFLTTIKTLTERFGEETAWELIHIYQDHYWTEADFDNLKKEGLNSVRLPITYFEMMNEDGSLKETAFDRMDWFIEEAAKRELYVIIDLHGAPGSQNGKDHSGDITYKDKGNLYGNRSNMDKTVLLWQEIAKRYKDEAWVAGYDLLNEPGGATGFEQYSFYDELYKAVREIDRNHILFIEAIWEPKDLPNPDAYEWENVAYSYHFYQYNNPQDYETQKSFIDSKVRFVEEANHQVPLYVGEFTGFGNVDSWEYILSVFEEQGWSYSTWTYKVTGQDSSWGMYTGTPPVVDIETDSEATIREKWSRVGTDTSYTRNDRIADVLQKYFTIR